MSSSSDITLPFKAVWVSPVKKGSKSNKILLDPPAGVQDALHDYNKKDDKKCRVKVSLDVPSNMITDEYDSDFDEANDYYGGFNYLNALEDVNDSKEFNFDEEKSIFDYDPSEEYFECFDLKQGDNDVEITYEALYQLAEMIYKLLGAWERRIPFDLETQDQDPLLLLDDDYLNLYQLEAEERSYLKAYSVWKLERLFGGRDEVLNVKQTAVAISSFTKRILMEILGNCLPHNLPYPVLNTIQDHLLLLPIKGAVKIIMVDGEELKEVEREIMIQLYLAMARLYDDMKSVMFYCGPCTATWQSILEKKKDLFNKFNILMTTVVQ